MGQVEFPTPHYSYLLGHKAEFQCWRSIDPWRQIAASCSLIHNNILLSTIPPMSSTKPRTRREALLAIVDVARSLKQRLTPQPLLAEPVSVPPLILICPEQVQNELNKLHAFPVIHSKVNTALQHLIVSFEKRYMDASYEKAAQSSHGQEIMTQLRVSLEKIFIFRAIPMIHAYILRANEAASNAHSHRQIPERPRPQSDSVGVSLLFSALVTYLSQ